MIFLKRKNGYIKCYLSERHVVKAVQPVSKVPLAPPVRNPLKRYGKPFYGLIQDVKIRYSQYWSDIRDGLSVQVLSTCIFIFFANLSPAITFGGIYGKRNIFFKHFLLKYPISKTIFVSTRKRRLVLKDVVSNSIFF